MEDLLLIKTNDGVWTNSEREEIIETALQKFLKKRKIRKHQVEKDAGWYYETPSKKPKLTVNTPETEVLGVSSESEESSDSDPDYECPSKYETDMSTCDSE